MSLDFKERSTAFERLVCLPPLAKKSIEALLASPQGSQALKLIQDGAQTNGNSSTEQQVAAEGLGREQRDALVASLTSGVSTLGEEAFKRRMRVITLLGWQLHPLDGNGAKAGGDAASPGPVNGRPSVYYKPENCTLVCGLCNAKAGLWNCFPDCQPQACPAPAVSVLQRAMTSTGGAAASRGAAGNLTTADGAVALVPKRHVSFDVSTTIAGGAMADEASSAQGNAPFGSVASAQPAFGAPGTAPAAAAAGIPDRAAESGTQQQQPATALTSPLRDVPVFGFAALRAQEPGSKGTFLDGGSTAKRRLEVTPESASPADKRPRGLGDGASSAAAGSRRELGAVANGHSAPSAAALQRYRNMAATSLDPLAMHRPFCPWVHAVHVIGAEGGGLCGWQWCVQQLVPGDKGTGAPRRAGDDAELGPDDQGGAAWDPAQLLRNTLAKVEVKK